MRKVPTFSIITPSYNQKKFIEETIESIWSQKGNFYIQHIVIDGKSTDKTVEILKRYERLLKQKRYHINCKGIEFIWKSEKDNGQAEAINKGFKLAKGDIFAYLNSDDTYEQRAFQRVAEAFNGNNSINLVYGDLWYIDTNTNKIKKVISQTYNRKVLLNKGNYISQPTVFWSRHLYKKVGIFNEDLHYTMDYEYWCRASQYCNFHYIKAPLANFRLHQNSKTVSLQDKFWKEQRHTSRRNGGKFFSEMAVRHYLFSAFLYIYKILPANLRRQVRFLVEDKLPVVIPE
ncbi:MAG: glycosyltransferase family 2 protein [Patescibacteria group bacterium]|jgi:glycosyltransferase involved in cell wall biosynthesis